MTREYTAEEHMKLIRWSSIGWSRAAEGYLSEMSLANLNALIDAANTAKDTDDNGKIT
jgi:hypothetical protein